MMEISQLIAAAARIETYWEPPEGFLYRLRLGEHDPTGSAGLIELLGSLDIDDESVFPRRFVSLTWWIPMFMEWQLDRVAELGGDVEAVRNDIVQIRNVLDRVLGVP